MWILGLIVIFAAFVIIAIVVIGDHVDRSGGRKFKREKDLDKIYDRNRLYNYYHSQENKSKNIKK